MFICKMKVSTGRWAWREEIHRQIRMLLTKTIPRVRVIFNCLVWAQTNLKYKFCFSKTFNIEGMRWSRIILVFTFISINKLWGGGRNSDKNREVSFYCFTRAKILGETPLVAFAVLMLVSDPVWYGRGKRLYLSK